ncbi:MAG: nitrous oxide-stimulated promoter family protein [Prevotellaceae bacterium]|nr:nitrous oxide-stimulated promoter family protein [Prevotellaceae bacterium]MDO4931256.1 nitrous oxide-stimulated promoter family protein [Prevotellaceae bacterium]
MTRIEREKKTVGEMIALYCRHKHGVGEKGVLCPECQELYDYAMLRLSRCRYGDAKPTCLHCTVHCYKPEMRKRIARVMRHSGPWMMLYHPWLTVRHLLPESVRH